MSYLQRALSLLPDRRGALEVGCGHGFFLERLQGVGFAAVKGIEPSADAVAKAGPSVKGHIVGRPFGPGLFAAESFSLVCGFQVLDHLIGPNETLQTCREILAPGGVMYWICHDAGSAFARALGERCPMVDIQHVVLYDRRTLVRLFQRNGFDVVSVFGVSNRYPLSYWATLVPMPQGPKEVLLGFLDKSRLGRLPFRANFGNMGIVAVKARSGSSGSVKVA